jgi:hypothetical protein
MQKPTHKKCTSAHASNDGPHSVQLSLATYQSNTATPNTKGGSDWLEIVPPTYPPKEEFRNVQASTSSQVNFVGGFFPQAKEGFSHTVELFDAIPKFVFAKLRRKKTLEFLVRQFEHRGEHYQLELKPAAVKTADGPFLIFPGEREELVLRALRYMAVQQLSPLSLWGHDQGHTQMRLVFTLSQLQNVLAEKVAGLDGKPRGHQFKLAEIDEALRVCRGATVGLEFDDGTKRARHEAGILSEYYALDEKTGDGQKALRCVIFHPLATTAALRQEYRSINYRRLMSLPSPLARWIYERLSHLFTNAEKRRPMLDTLRTPKGFSLDLETVLNQSGVLRRKRLRGNIEEVRSALKELSVAGVLLSPSKGTPAYVENIVRGESKKVGGQRPIIGAVWTLYPSDLLVQEIIDANIEYRDRPRLPGGGK